MITKIYCFSCEQYRLCAKLPLTESLLHVCTQICSVCCPKATFDFVQEQMGQQRQQKQTGQSTLDDVPRMPPRRQDGVRLRGRPDVCGVSDHGRLPYRWTER